MTTDRGRDDVLRRLKRVEGQIRGLQRLVAADTYCVDVLTQVAAASRALQACALLLAEEHLAGCVAGVDPADPAAAGETARRVRELSDAIALLVRGDEAPDASSTPDAPNTPDVSDASDYPGVTPGGPA